MTIKDQIWLLAHSKEPEDRREWAVLYWKYQNKTHRQVGKQLSHGKDWVQRYMTHAYKRFGCPEEYDRDEKWDWLVENVFPALKDFLEDNPDTVKDLPEPDDVSMEDVPHPPAPPEPPVIVIDSPKRLPSTSGPNYIRLIILLIVFVGIVSAVGYAAYELGQRSTPTPAPVITAVTAITQVIPSAPALSPTPAVVPTNVPTDTQIPTPQITETPIPSPTIPFVPPADGILFQDNFDKVWKSDWNLGTDWIISNGALSQTTQAAFHNYYSWATLNKPEWKNYLLSVDINIPYMNSGAQSNVAVAVRVNGQTKYLGVQILPFVGNALFFIGTSSSDSDAVASSRVFEFESGSTLQIEANGNSFTVSVNGRQVQQVSLSGYDSGGIALGIDCLSSLGCPSFDNVKVTYLP